MLLEEFKHIYKRYRWLRYITWVGLLCAALFLLWASGNFFPQALFALVRALFQGSAIALLALPTTLLTWVGMWYLLLRGILILLRHQRRSALFRQQWRGEEWVSSRQLSLAVSTPGGASVDDTFTVDLPRLRLPQRPSQPLPAETYGQKRMQPQRTPEQLAIQEIPTRPDNSANMMGRALPLQPLVVGVGWHSGILRRHSPNEDSLVVLQGTCTYHGQLVPFGLFVVADGMGGHEGGQEASRIAIQSMMHTVLQNIVMSHVLNDEFLIDMMIGGADWANQAIFLHAQAEGKNMGTTLTAALVVGMKAYIVNVGDSRTYLYREGANLAQITRDHSLVASLVARGEISPDDVYTHPERGKVYRCLGGESSVMVDWFMADLYPHDRLLLCSDGLWEMVRDPEIERILRSSNDPTRVSETLVQAALRNGGADNISAIVLRVP